MWSEAQNVVKQVTLTKAEDKRFFLQQKFFEEEENMGHMLAMLVKSQKGTLFISAVNTVSRETIYTHSDILLTFQNFYADLYSSNHLL